MKKSELEKYLGKIVTVKLFDDSVYSGRLRKTGTEELRDENYTLFCTQGRYFLEADYDVSTCFRSSHVKKLKEGRHEL